MELRCERQLDVVDKAQIPVIGQDKQPIYAVRSVSGHTVGAANKDVMVEEGNLTVLGQGNHQIAA